MDTATFSQTMKSYASPLLGTMGAVNSAVGSYFSASSSASNLKFQQSMAAINARMLELQAQSALETGQREAGAVSLKAGKVKSSQIASQGARGIVVGVGNAAEEVATTDLMKEIDMMTIDANAVRSAWASRMGAVNASNQGLMAGATASGISPFGAAGTSLLESATSVSSSWYKSLDPQGYYQSQYGGLLDYLKKGG